MNFETVVAERALEPGKAHRCEHSVRYGSFHHGPCGRRAKWEVSIASRVAPVYLCGMHSPEHDRKVKAKSDARYAERKREWQAAADARTIVPELVEAGRAVVAAYLSSPGLYPVEVSSAIAELGRKLERFPKPREDAPGGPGA